MASAGAGKDKVVVSGQIGIWWHEKGGIAAMELEDMIRAERGRCERREVPSGWHLVEVRASVEEARAVVLELKRKRRQSGEEGPKVEESKSVRVGEEEDQRDCNDPKDKETEVPPVF